MIIDNCMSLITDWIETFLLLSVALKPGANSDIKLGQAPLSIPTINWLKGHSSGVCLHINNHIKVIKIVFYKTLQVSIW